MSGLQGLVPRGSRCSTASKLAAMIDWVVDDLAVVDPEAEPELGSASSVDVDAGLDLQLRPIDVVRDLGMCCAVASQRLKDDRQFWSVERRHVIERFQRGQVN